MIRLAIVTVLLAVGLVVVRRRQAKGPKGDVLRVASRTGISRGVMAAVLEVEQRRFLVTITPTSTTLVAELGPTGAPLAGGALPGGALPGLPATAGSLDTGVSHDVVRPDVVVAVAPPTFGPGSVATAPSPAAAPPAAAAVEADGTFLDRLRARTVRTYDPELVAAIRAER